MSGAKKPAVSAVETRYILMPHEANAHGTAFGGTIMGWIDIVGSMAAQRHCGRQVVTAAIDSLNFRTPVHIGEHVVLRSCVNYVGRTSMEVGVRVTREDPYTGDEVVATTAHLTFVALDEGGRPVEVCAIEPVSDDEKRRYENAKLRMEARRELLGKLKGKG
jgi:acyl-CoA hydrolase